MPSCLVPLFVLATSLVTVVSTPPSTIILTPTNHLTVLGTIDAASASAFVHGSQRQHATVEYVYIDSPGGSVAAGARMVAEMQQRNYTCVVDTAYSMAFGLVQACTRRLVRPSGSMMQHQITVSGVHGELGKVLARLHNIDRIRQRLDRMQAARLNLTEAVFVARTANEWWFDADDAVEHRCVDRLAPPIACSASLLKQTIRRTETASLGLFATATIFEYSACPLVSEPLREVASASVPMANVTHSDGGSEGHRL